MGTRSLIRIIKEKKTRVAQYCQWDGYPGGVGLDLLQALRGIDEVKFSSQIEKCAFVPNKDEDEAFWRKASKYNNRDLAASIIYMILNDESEKIYLFNSGKFSEDKSWFMGCQYEWVIDLDSMTFGEGDSERFPILVLPSDENFLAFYEKLYQEED